MAKPEEPLSQLDAFLSTPMGPGLDDERGAPVELRDQPGQGSYPTGVHEGSSGRQAAAVDPTVGASGEALGSKIARQMLAEGGEADRSAPDQTLGVGREGSITDPDPDGV